MTVIKGREKKAHLFFSALCLLLSPNGFGRRERASKRKRRREEGKKREKGDDCKYSSSFIHESLTFKSMIE